MTVTVTECHPVAPSGLGGRRVSGWGSPVASAERTSSGAVPSRRPTSTPTASRCPCSAPPPAGVVPGAAVDAHLDARRPPGAGPMRRRPRRPSRALTWRRPRDVDPREGPDRCLPAHQPRGSSTPRPRRTGSPRARRPTWSPTRSRRDPGRPSAPGSRARAAAARRSSPTASSASRPSVSAASGVPAVKPSVLRESTMSASAAGRRPGEHVGDGHAEPRRGADAGRRRPRSTRRSA